MRYLKSFNEGTSFLPEDLNELQYFCETYLAYLIDEGFGIRVRHGSRKDRARVEFYKEDHIHPVPFNHLPCQSRRIKQQLFCYSLKKIK